MKTRIRNLFLLPALTASLGLILGGRATAQNYAAWPVTRIAAGGEHSLFTKSDGSLWVMGDNGYGQSGIDPALANTNVPTQILPSGVGALAAGEYHSLFQMGSSLWAMGDDEWGQLGDGANTNHYVPEQVVSLARGTSFSGFAAGGLHSLYGTVNSSLGNFFGMGDDVYGELGDGNASGGATNKPEVIFSVIHESAIMAVAGGANHSLFVKPGGSLWAMGDDTFGQLGDGVPNITLINSTNRPEQIVPSGVTAVAGGTQHSLFIESDGSLWGMGQNSSGQLGTGVIVDGYGTIRTNLPVQILPSGVVAIAAGTFYSLFIKSDGSLWGMGYNGVGQLGDGTTNSTASLEEIVPSNVVAVAAGDGHTLFIKSDGSLWGMGANGSGQLGTGDYVDRHTPVEIVSPPPPPVLQITGIARQTNDIQITWLTTVGTTNALQATSGGSGGSYSTNGFADIFAITNTVNSVTNYLDTGGATNFPARYYRVRLVP
jgi:hypothetical protein